MKLLAIDPGNEQSAIVAMNGREIISGNIHKNDELLTLLSDFDKHHLAIEMIASYGMPVGKTVFETCVWIGRFIEGDKNKDSFSLVYRKDIKMHLCGTMRAKDAHIRQALIDRHGKVKGFKKDIWSALALATYWTDNFQD